MQVKTEDGVEEKYRPHEHEEENGSRGRPGENGARFGAMAHNNDDHYNNRYGGYQ